MWLNKTRPFQNDRKIIISFVCTSQVPSNSEEVDLRRQLLPPKQTLSHISKEFSKMFKAVVFRFFSQILTLKIRNTQKNCILLTAQLKKF